MSKKIARPVRDRIVCHQLSGEGETKTESGIILPASDNGEDKIRAKVVAVGSGAVSEYGQRIPMEVKVGDEIIFEKGIEEDIVLGGRSFLVIMEAEVICIIEDA